MADKGNSETFCSLAGSNLQICFVNEHHQASEASDSDTVSSSLIQIRHDLLLIEESDQYDESFKNLGHSRDAFLEGTERRWRYPR